MHKLIKFYYDNKTKIIKIGLLIIFILLIIQLMNYIAKLNNQKEEKGTLISTEQNNNDSNKENTNTSVTTEKSAVTGELVDDKQITNAQNIIEQFVSYCNNGETEKAYNLLSKDCKDEVYKSLEAFETLYYKENFGGNIKKTATIENWFGNTYAVYISTDIMATGKIEDTKKRDYYTLVDEDGSTKLNINSFIKKENINKEQTENNITYKIISKNVYMDYEEYTVQVQNGSENTILLDSMQSTKTIYLEDEKSVKYYCYTNEIISEFLKVNKGASTQLKLRFMRSYSSSQKNVSLVFSDIITNYTGSKDKTISREKVMLNI